MKRVLFVSDNFVGGGLETRILEQVKMYKNIGIKSFLIGANINKTLCGDFESIGILPLIDRRPSAILKLTDQIIEFCHKNKIEMIDCQPLFCFVPAALAAAQLNIPIHYTLHGVYSAPNDGTSYSKLFSLLLKNLTTRVIVVGDHLRSYYADILPDDNLVRLVSNGIVMDDHKATLKPRQGYFAYASRLSNEKVRILIETLPKLDKLGVRELDIYGGGDDKKKITDFMRNHKLKIKINFCGWAENFREQLVKKPYAGVIGMGRVAIEALAVDLPTLVLSYDGLAGFVTKENLQDFVKFNFTKQIDTTDVKKEMDDLKQNRERYQLRKNVSSELNSELIWEKVAKEVMTEKVNPKNQMWSDLIITLLDETNKENDELRQKILDLENSTSWRLTAPLRRLNTLFKSR